MRLAALRDFSFIRNDALNKCRILWQHIGDFIHIRQALYTEITRSLLSRLADRFCLPLLSLVWNGRYRDARLTILRNELSHVSIGLLKLSKFTVHLHKKQLALVQRSTQEVNELEVVA